MVQAYFQNLGFSAEEAGTIASKFVRQELEKNDLFVKEGKTSKQIAFLEKGLLQYYSITDKGEERTTYVTLPNNFAASLLSYLSEIPARENIRAITASVIWTIEKNDMQTLQQDLPAFNSFYIGLLEWQICCIDKGKFDLITLSAEDRYAKMMKEEPEILQQVPLQYIASMMGMTPRHLSRLRGKM
ncbi:MAG: Crp/Fnr family transcriptional regulator [Chitinophagaceae bacterium]